MFEQEASQYIIRKSQEHQHSNTGTGKTYLAKALATRSQHKLIALSASDLMSKYQGESEKVIRAVMEEARKRKPCIIFLDEIDSIGRKRKQDEKESMRRIKNELLKQMDGVGAKNEGVVVRSVRARDFHPSLLSLTYSYYEILISRFALEHRYLQLRMRLGRSILLFDVVLRSVCLLTYLTLKLD